MQTLVIKTKSDMHDLLRLYQKHPPLVAAFDTESTGLSIIEDMPFLFQFGWYNQDTDIVYVGIIDLEETEDAKECIKLWHTRAKCAPIYLAHNIKFDLHMLTNLGTPYTYNNISDSIFYIRFANDNIPVDKGGVPLGLKDYCAKYIDPTAKLHDNQIQLERSAIAKKLNNQLKVALGWTLKEVDEFFKDATNISEDFPTVQDYLVYTNWVKSLPKEIKTVNLRGRLTRDDIPYTMVNKETMLKYAALDIWWVIKIYLQTAPVIKARGTEVGLKIENDCIEVMFDIERQGFTIDRDYVTKSFYRMRSYIRQRRQDLKDYTQMDITANQHKVLLKYFQDNGLNLDSTGAEVLNRVHKDYPNHPVQKVIDVILELRTLEKWFSTYLMRFLDKDKVYTQINQVGAASLRISSDFQQFPSEGIYTTEGEELFNPRRAVKVPKGIDNIVYLDYSQIELRVQALYTILVGHPDMNLCRAYMPYNCWAANKTPFDYKDPQHIAQAYTADWFHMEDNTPWYPVDVHGATTKAAFDIDESHPDYKHLRGIGKRVNFAKNYGAQLKKISEMFPDYDDNTIKAIDSGYYKAFPGIKHYQQYCYELGNYQPYATNLFGVRYWGVSGHNLINMLIQGSSATLMKLQMIELHKFLKNYNTQMSMPIHDENQFFMMDDELHLIPQLKKIMEDWEVYVPIVADTEITQTYWSDKKDYVIA